VKDYTDVPSCQDLSLKEEGRDDYNNEDFEPSSGETAFLIVNQDEEKQQSYPATSINTDILRLKERLGLGSAMVSSDIMIFG
jgi:hypothetical protein